MSIVSVAHSLVAQRRLLDRPSSLLLCSARTMLVTPDIDAIARLPFADTLEGERHAAVAAFLDAFCELGEVTVSENPKRKPNEVMLARVYPVGAEFWSMRITDPDYTAGMRILGAFYDKDCFVGLKCDFREDMNFDAEVDDVREVWKDYFGALPPHKGRNLDDYLTNYYKIG